MPRGLKGLFCLPLSTFYHQSHIFPNWLVLSPHWSPSSVTSLLITFHPMRNYKPNVYALKDHKTVKKVESKLATIFCGYKLPIWWQFCGHIDKLPDVSSFDSTFQQSAHLGCKLSQFWWHFSAKTKPNYFVITESPSVCIWLWCQPAMCSEITGWKVSSDQILPSSVPIGSSS